MNREMLMLVDAISREKNVERDVVFGAVELALAQATKKIYTGEVDIRVAVDRDSGNNETYLRWLVVPDEAGLQNPEAEELVSDARDEDPAFEAGDFMEKPVESKPIGRIGAMAAKQVILHKIRDAEREMLLTEFMSRGDKIFVGTVKRMDKGDIIVESGRVEGRLRRSRPSTRPLSTMMSPLSIRLTVPTKIFSPRDMKSLSSISRSASRIFCKITCLAAIAPIRPIGTDATVSSMYSSTSMSDICSLASNSKIS